MVIPQTADFLNFRKRKNSIIRFSLRQVNHFLDFLSAQKKKNDKNDIYNVPHIFYCNSILKSGASSLGIILPKRSILLDF